MNGQGELQTMTMHRQHMQGLRSRTPFTSRAQSPHSIHDHNARITMDRALPRSPAGRLASEQAQLRICSCPTPGRDLPPHHQPHSCDDPAARPHPPPRARTRTRAHTHAHTRQHVWHASRVNRMRFHVPDRGTQRSSCNVVSKLQLPGMHINDGALPRGTRQPASLF